MKVLIKAALVAAISASLLNACAVGPDYKRPTQVGDITIQASAIKNDANADALQDNLLNWWQQFEDDSLNLLVRTAMEENRDIRQAQWNAKRAYAAFSQQSLQQIPQGDISASSRAMRNADAASVNQNILRTENLNLNLRWNMDIFGKLRRASEAASARAEQANILWREAQLQIISQVVSSYAQYRGAELRWVVAQLNLQFLLQSQEIIEAQIEAGVATNFELAQMQAQVEQVKANIPRIKQQEFTAKATLAALLGKSMNGLTIAKTSHIPKLDKPITVTLEKDYLQYRSDIAAAERALAASSADIGVATADLYPDISISGFLGYLGSPNLALNSGNESWSVAPTLNWSGLNYGRVRAGISIANANAQIALNEFEQTVINAINDMQLSLKNYALSQQHILISERHFKATENAVNIARERYKAGTINFLQMLDTERELLASRDQLAQSQEQNFLHLVDVYRSFNGALQVNQSITPVNNIKTGH
ncbi:efflux transporter outer membrane subunit [Alteromonas sp. a30]|uniref:efflux transporter outer membrane subunit n=1 Tax=Alteromonas sp. a30 TaxID=2730917 RepID=UPI0022811ACC|nr:efflux transporter outer membrane subunit [Alteromonas sp. a30]MCY7293931.1 efflux transporter outer membrane subunit [Alteromonas sp. a30]